MKLRFILRFLPAFGVLLFSVTAWSDGFRNSDWGATVGEVRQQEEAAPLGRTEQKNGGFYLTYVQEMLGQAAEIRYFFDPLCGRLVAGSFSFDEPLTENYFLGVIMTFGNIYGSDEPITDLNGGSLAKWHDGETTIHLMHLPRGVDVPELADRPPTMISYRYRDGKPTDCDFNSD